MVYEAIHKNKNKNKRMLQHPIAIKVVKIKDKEMFEKIKFEIGMLSLCKHPNIIQYEATYYFKNALFMVNELMDYG